MVDVRATAGEVVQWCKDSLTQHMSVTLRDCVPSALAKAMSDSSKSKAETLIGRLTMQLQTEHTGGAKAEAQLDNERKRVKDPESELELENESMKKQLVESSIEYKRDTNGNFVDMNVEYLEKDALKEITRVINKWTIERLTDGSTYACAIMQDAGIRPVRYTIAGGTFFQEEVHVYVGTTILVHAPKVLPFKEEQSVHIVSIYTIIKWLSTLLKKARRLSVHTRVAIFVHARHSTLDTQHQLSWERNSALAIIRQFVAGVQPLDDVLSWKRNQQTGELQLGKVHMRNLMIVHWSSAMNYAPLKQSILSLHAREVDEELDDVPCPKAHHVRLDCPITVAPTPLQLLITLNGFGL